MENRDAVKIHIQGDSYSRAEVKIIGGRFLIQTYYKKFNEKCVINENTSTAVA